MVREAWESRDQQPPPSTPALNIATTSGSTAAIQQQQHPGASPLPPPPSPQRSVEASLSNIQQFIAEAKRGLQDVVVAVPKKTVAAPRRSTRDVGCVSKQPLRVKISAPLHPPLAPSSSTVAGARQRRLTTTERLLKMAKAEGISGLEDVYRMGTIIEPHCRIFDCARLASIANPLLFPAVKREPNTARREKSSRQGR